MPILSNEELAQIEGVAVLLKQEQKPQTEPQTQTVDEARTSAAALEYQIEKQYVASHYRCQHCLLRQPKTNAICLRCKFSDFEPLTRLVPSGDFGWPPLKTASLSLMPWTEQLANNLDVKALAKIANPFGYRGNTADTVFANADKSNWDSRYPTEQKRWARQLLGLLGRDDLLLIEVRQFPTFNGQPPEVAR